MGPLQVFRMDAQEGTAGSYGDGPKFNFLRSCQTVSMAAAQRFPSPHILANTCCFLEKRTKKQTKAILVGVKWVSR